MALSCMTLRSVLPLHEGNAWWECCSGGQKVFGWIKEGRSGAVVPLYTRECFRACFDCVELEDSDNKVECVWLGSRGKANQADVLVGAATGHTTRINCTMSGWLMFQNSLVVGGSNLPDICWILNTAERRPSRGCLEWVEENFLTSWPGKCPAGTDPGTMPHWTCWLPADKGWWEMGWSEAVWGTATWKWGTSNTWWRQERGIPWTPEGWTLANSGHCFEEYLAKQPIKSEGPQESWNLKGRGADCACHAERWTGGKADWSGWARIFPIQSGKKECAWPLEKGTGKTGSLEMLFRSCRKKVFTLLSLRHF